MVFRLQESGILSYWILSLYDVESKYMRPYFEASNAVKNEPKKLAIQNLSGAFMLLFGGLCVASFMHVVERIHFYFTTSIV